MNLPEIIAMRQSGMQNKSSERPAVGRFGHAFYRYVAPLALYLAVIFATTPSDLGDSIYYVQDIQRFIGHPNSAAWQVFLDFGHLLWRPIGWAVLQGSQLFLHPGSQEEVRLLLTAILIGLSMVCGAIATLLMMSLFRRLDLPYVPSLIAVLAFAGSNAVLNISQSGSCYSAALAALTAALWVVVGPHPGDRLRPGRAWLGGTFLALSFLLWLPFVLIVPAVAAAAAIPWHQPPGRLRLSTLRLAGAVHLLAATAVLGAVAFATAACLLHVTSLHELAALANSTAHGWRQSKTFLRVGTGLPRCCLALGDDGILWKRFLFRDPYVHVGIADVLLGSLPKLAAFYAGLLFMALTLIRSVIGRRLLSLTLIAFVPVVVFAVLFFEPSSIERFMPVLPFFSLALALQLSLLSPSLKWSLAALALPALILITSLTFHMNTRVEKEWSPTIARIQNLKREVPSGSTVVLLDNADQILSFVNNRPLHPDYPSALKFWVAIRLANERVFQWRRAFADKVIDGWTTSGEVWVSVRLLSAVPRADWGWVEGDDSAIHWREIPGFFARLDFNRQIGGDDGFLRLPQSGRNREILNELLTIRPKPGMAH
jgi:hypothetical protein